MLPSRWGLYEPITEHDACGVGFVAHIQGQKSREIVEQALEVLRRLSHRAATGSDPETGDGAGIQIQIPHRFFKREGIRLGFDMPRRRSYGIGMVFLPSDPAARRACEETLDQVVAEEGQRLVGWRDVPVDPGQVGRVAGAVLPVIRQVYVARRRLVPTAFERKLYVIRKLTENRIRERGLDPDGRFHIPSLSSETIVYKGLLLPGRLAAFYRDLDDPDFVSAIAVVHSRFSTNTFPTWDLAQPFRYIAHNGEINTVQGNRNWMNARKSLLESAKFGGRLDRLFPIIVPGKSDSAQFDNMLELLHLGGRSLPHAMMLMIPEAWEQNPEMDPARADFYRYSSTLMEPWDGPAAIVFSDGHLVGATLDRNGLRPARYVVTSDDRVILASEAGVIDVPPHQVREKGRLRPGRMFLVDTTAGRILSDEEVKHDVTSRYPYGRWLRQNVFEMPDVDPAPEVPALPVAPAATTASGEPTPLTRLQRAFGYSLEDLRLLIAPMGEAGKEPVGSMGTDTPVAVLSDQAPPLFAYFHQLFAQVTNPPIDPIREALVMTLDTTIGPDGNTFEETPEQCHTLHIPGPILTNAQLDAITRVTEGVFDPVRLDMTYPLSDEPGALGAAVERLCADATAGIDDGSNILILSDRAVGPDRAPIPALLGLSAVQQHLCRLGIRMQAGLLVETGDAREVHDMALLIGYGAAAINPYLALDTVAQLAASGELADGPDGVGHPSDPLEAQRRYIDAIKSGLKKIMSKMGISSVQSYRGAQIFEAVGLDRELIDRHFTGTPSRLGGIGLAELGREVKERHGRGFGDALRGPATLLPVGGLYQWRRGAERHKWRPDTIAALQAAIFSEDPDKFAHYSRLIDDEDGALCTLRGMLDFDRSQVAPVPLDEVEPASEIVKRFVTGAMSFGSISAEAHETLAIAMNRIGGKSNSGEGGEEERRFVPDENGDWRRSAIKQVASGRFGVTANYLVNAAELQIKMAQGAKPGEGGQLPGHKVDDRIAKVRYSTPGVTLISPPPHHDIYSIEDLKQLIYDLQAVNPTARVSVKLVSEVGVGTVAAGRGQGRRRRGGHRRVRGRHRRLAAVQPQARRPAVGAGPGRDPAGAGAERPAPAHPGPGRRRPQDRPRRGGGGADGRRGVRHGHRVADRDRLHHAAQVPPQHLLGRHRDPGSRAAQALRRHPRAGGQLLHAGGRRGPPADGRAGYPPLRRPGRPGRPAQAEGRCAPLEGREARPRPAAGPARRAGRAVPHLGACPTASGSSWPTTSTTSSCAGPPAPSAAARRSRSSCRCATPTARSVRCCRVRCRAGTARAGCPTTPSGSGCAARPGRASARSWRPGSPSSSRARPTTSSARACRAATSWSSRPAGPPSCPSTTSSSATPACTAPPAARRSSAAWPASGSRCATAARGRWSRAWATTAAST